MIGAVHAEQKTCPVIPVFICRMNVCIFYFGVFYTVPDLIMYFHGGYRPTRILYPVIKLQILLALRLPDGVQRVSPPPKRVLPAAFRWRYGTLFLPSSTFPETLPWVRAYSDFRISADVIIYWYDRWRKRC